MNKNLEWLSEPNKLEWEYEGYRCVIIRNSNYGHLCGYVKVQYGHPWWGQNVGDDSINDIEVHGGITFSDNYLPIKPYVRICNYWWLGFDAGHYDDIFPFGDKFDTTITNATYKNIEFIKNETEKLARYCKEASKYKRIDNDLRFRTEEEAAKVETNATEKKPYTCECKYKEVNDDEPIKIIEIGVCQNKGPENIRLCKLATKIWYKLLKSMEDRRTFKHAWYEVSNNYEDMDHYCEINTELRAIVFKTLVEESLKRD